MTKKQIDELANIIEIENKKIVKYNEKMRQEILKITKLNSEFESLQKNLQNKLKNTKMDRLKDNIIKKKQIESEKKKQIISGILFVIIIIVVFCCKNFYNKKCEDFFKALVFAISAFFAIDSINTKEDNEIFSFVKKILSFSVVLITFLLFLNVLFNFSLFSILNNSDFLLDFVAVISLFISIINNIKHDSL